MSELDTAQEWRRLQEAYAGMSEEELAAVADEGFQLTDLAKQALKAEISKRGLQVVVRLAPNVEGSEPVHGDFDPADLDLRVALSVRSRDQADRVRNTLQRAGIPCFFGPDLADDIDRLQYSQDGVAVRVLASDVARTLHVLQDFLAEVGNEDELPAFSGQCPKCHSTEIVLESVDSSADQQPGDTDEDEDHAAEPREGKQPAGSAKFHWNCDACGYHWTDDGIETES